jgi:hypothetical protein
MVLSGYAEGLFHHAIPRLSVAFDRRIDTGTAGNQ